ncbi:hypothetical protein JTE90_017643 [Oedothorax gibbosus]|uniref:L-Fucosyltransferase n=1 Tax=Oedothorax gibbosus TaxID=931172 RepID=A0AAV6U874_9ARAC|nr:hypothetical protein JTE90_017643 [Oedothorax gibbosus]
MEQMCTSYKLVVYGCDYSATEGKKQFVSSVFLSNLNIDNDWNRFSYIPHNSNFIKGFLYPCSYTFFDDVQDEIRKEFRFADRIQRHAENVIRMANVHHLTNVTYVGVHVRRGDYRKAWLNAFGGAEVTMEYFQKAVDFFTRKYRTIVFVLVSDDRMWCIQNLSSRFGMYVAEEAPSPAYDMAVLANCNHTLMTYGTFGFWGAYLAGGDVVYLDKFLLTNTTFAKESFIFEKMYPARWIGIAITDTLGNSSYRNG